MSLIRTLVLVTGTAAVAVTALPAAAACGPGKVPTYADIQSVSYSRTNCFGRCPAYDVLFTGYDDCEYVGQIWVSMPGTYSNKCAPNILKRAIAALKLHAFYTLDYDSRVLVVDAPHYIVSAMRCGVVTKLDWPAYQNRRDIESLLDALDNITQSIPWKKISDDTSPHWIQ